jgi:hypothetical protein
MVLASFSILAHGRVCLFFLRCQETNETNFYLIAACKIEFQQTFLVSSPQEIAI